MVPTHKVSLHPSDQHLGWRFVHSRRAVLAGFWEINWRSARSFQFNSPRWHLALATCFRGMASIDLRYAQVAEHGVKIRSPDPLPCSQHLSPKLTAAFSVIPRAPGLLDPALHSPDPGIGTLHVPPKQPSMRGVMYHQRRNEHQGVPVSASPAKVEPQGSLDVRHLRGQPG